MACRLLLLLLLLAVAAWGGTCVWSPAAYTIASWGVSPDWNQQTLPVNVDDAQFNSAAPDGIVARLFAIGSFLYPTALDIGYSSTGDSLAVGGNFSATPTLNSGWDTAGLVEFEAVENSRTESPVWLIVACGCLAMSRRRRSRSR
jgi:hypothetical protein